MKKRILHDSSIAEKTLSDILERARELLWEQIKEKFILNGWKEIGRFFGLRECHTMRRWAVRHKLPYMVIGGRVSVPTVTAIEWYINVWKIVNKEGGSDEYVRQLVENLKGKGKKV
jgi:hypothetical protein